MRKLLVLSILLFSISASAEKVKISVKKGKHKVNMQFELFKDFEVKTNFLNSPILVWHKKLKHHGPSIGFTPYNKTPKGFGQKKNLNYFYTKFKKDETKNLKTLKARNIKFKSPESVKNGNRYRVSYSFPGISNVQSTETHRICGNKKALKIRTVLKGEHLKEFQPILLKMIDELKCD